jgi:hypothetical protein
LALWNEFKVNNILDIKESEGHCLHLWFRHAVLKAPRFSFGDNFGQKVVCQLSRKIRSTRQHVNTPRPRDTHVLLSQLPRDWR